MTLQLNASEIISILRKHIAACGLIRPDAMLAIEFLLDGKVVEDVAQTLVCRLIRMNDPNQILEAVCEEFQTSTEAVLGKSRRENLVIPRHVLMALLSLSGMTLTAIAEFCGGRDHNTVGNAIENVRDWIDTNPAFAERASSLAAHLGLHLSELRRRRERVALKQPQIAAA